MTWRFPPGCTRQDKTGETPVPALFVPSLPIGKMWIDSLASLRWIVGAEISIEGKISAMTQQTGISIDLQTKKPIRIPERLQQHDDESRSNS